MWNQPQMRMDKLFTIMIAIEKETRDREKRGKMKIGAKLLFFLFI